MSEADERPSNVLVRAPQGMSQPDGAVEGYRAERTLPVRAELGRQLRRRRTRWSLGFLAVLPLLLLLAFEVGDQRPRGSATFADVATSGGLNFAVFTLLASTGFLLVVIVALFFGDTVASEASWSTLKYLLAAPVPRVRLLRQKALAAGILSGFGLVLLPAVATVVGLIRYGGADLTSPNGPPLDLPTGLLTLAAAVAYLAVHLTWVAGAALWLSVSTNAPLGAVGGAVLMSILSHILNEISALGPLRGVLPTHYSDAWTSLLTDEPNWTDLANGAFSGLAYATVFAALAAWRFSRRDITS